jgi:hypothetical protein
MITRFGEVPGPLCVFVVAGRDAMLLLDRRARASGDDAKDRFGIHTDPRKSKNAYARDEFPGARRIRRDSAFQILGARILGHYRNHG